VRQTSLQSVTSDQHGNAGKVYALELILSSAVQTPKALAISAHGNAEGVG
jgi:hypothetical protein